MRKGWVLVVAGLMAATVAACQKKNDDQNVTSDTTTVQGQDTVNGQSVPVTDTVVKTTTTDVDTTQGKANADTTKKGKQ